MYSISENVLRYISSKRVVGFLDKLCYAPLYWNFVCSSLPAECINVIGTPNLSRIAQSVK